MIIFFPTCNFVDYSSQVFDFLHFSVSLPLDLLVLVITGYEIWLINICQYSKQRNWERNIFTNCCLRNRCKTALEFAVLKLFSLYGDAFSFNDLIGDIEKLGGTWLVMEEEEEERFEQELMEGSSLIAMFVFWSNCTEALLARKCLGMGCSWDRVSLVFSFASVHGLCLCFVTLPLPWPMRFTSAYSPPTPTGVIGWLGGVLASSQGQPITSVWRNAEWSARDKIPY